MKGLVNFSLCVLSMVLSFAPCAEASQRVVHLHFRNTVIFDFEIKSHSVNTFILAMAGQRLLMPEDETMYVVILSPGGSLPDSYKLREALSRVPRLEVICDECASGAGFAFATTEAPRLVTKDSVLIMHEMYYLHVTAKLLNNPGFMKSTTEESDRFNQQFYSRIGISKKEFEDKIENREWVIHGQDIVRLHLADQFVRLECEENFKSVYPQVCDP